MFLRNVRSLSPAYTALYPRRYRTSVFALSSPVSEAMAVDVGHGIPWILKFDSDDRIFSRNAYHTVSNAGYKVDMLYGK
jgi:hypothetical protein